MKRRVVALAVAALSCAGVPACSESSRGGNDASAALPPAPAFVGFGWRLVRVEHAGKAYRMPTCFAIDADSRCVRATVDFLPGGEIVMDDTVNALSGHYRVTAHGFKTGIIGTTLVGGGWPDARRRAGLDAIDALATTPNSNGVADNGATVRAGRAGSRLVLEANGFRLFLAKRGPATLAPGAEP